MINKLEAGDCVKYKIHVVDESGNRTNEILEEGESEILYIQNNGNVILDIERGLIALPEECEKIIIPKWHRKIRKVIKKVLGDDYDIIILSDKEIHVSFKGNKILKRQTLYDIPSHWQYDINDVIKIIIDQKIKESIKQL